MTLFLLCLVFFLFGGALVWFRKDWIRAQVLALTTTLKAKMTKTPPAPAFAVALLFLLFVVVPPLRAQGAPVTGTASIGQQVTITVTASGTLPFTYQWMKGGVPITGATAQSYVIAAAKTTDAGVYTVTVANSAGSTLSNTATLTVNIIPPTIQSIGFTVSGSPATSSNQKTVTMNVAMAAGLPSTATVTQTGGVTLTVGTPSPAPVHGHNDGPGHDDGPGNHGHG
jgi:Immunoglobulin domain